MLIKEQMILARKHIRAKQYSEARAILTPIDHPKAREWLARLDQIDESTPTMIGQVPAPPPRSSSRRGVYWVSAIMVIALMGAGSLALFLFSQSNTTLNKNEAYPLARYFPDDTIGYADIRTDDEHIKTWDNLMEHIQASLPPIVSGLLGEETYTLSDSLDLLTEMSLNADFQTAMRSWLGDQVAVGVYNLPVAMENYMTGDPDIGVAGVVQITNRDEAVAFVEQLLSMNPMLTYTQSNSDGYTFFRFAEATAPIIMINDEVMIIASPYAVSIIQNGIPKSLAESPEFIETMGLLPESRYNATMYFQFEHIFRSMLPAFEMMQSQFSEIVATVSDEDSSATMPTSFSFEDFLPDGITLDEAIDAIGQMAVGFTILDDYTIVVDGVHNAGDVEILKQFDFLIPNTKATNPEFLTFVPENAAFVVQGTDIKAYIDRMLEMERYQLELVDKYAGLFPNVQEDMETYSVQGIITSIDEIIQPATQLTVQENILNWMTGDYAYFVNYEPSMTSMLFNYYYPDEQFQQNVEAGVLIEVTNAEQARLVVDSLGSAIPLILKDSDITISYEDIAGHSVIVVTIPPRDLLSIPLEIVIGSNDKVLVIATRQSATDVLNGQGGFKSSAGYTKVQPRLLSEIDSFMYINDDGFNFIADAVIGLLSPLMDNMFTAIVSELGETNSGDLTEQQQRMFEQQRQALPMTVQTARWVTALFDSMTVSTTTNDNIDTVSRFTWTFAE